MKITIAYKIKNLRDDELKLLKIEINNCEI